MMKSRKWLFIAVAMAILSAAESAFAQQCYITYTPDFSSYANEAADETYIYTAVGVDGSGVMSTSGSCPNLSSIYHYPTLLNSIGSVSSGWVSGNQYCPDCYVSDEQDEDIPYDPTLDYDFDYEAQMNCSFAGNFFDVAGSIIIGARTSNYILNGMQGNQCEYILYCPNGNTHSTCGVQVPTIYAAGPPVNACTNYLHDTRIVVNGQCFPVGIAVMAANPVDCN